MPLSPRRALLPQSPATIERVDAAARSVSERLRPLAVERLAISDYSKRYFGSYLAALDSVLDRYSFILAWALAPGDLAGRPANVLLDYGGGSGVLSMLARAAGVPTVIYDDIFATSCADAKTIADAAGLTADHYVHGEIDTVITFVRNKGISVDAVANNDVIEHIYDMAAFVRALPRLSSGPLTVSLATGANIHNPFTRPGLERGQRMREHEPTPVVWGHKECDSVRPYLEIRRDIIRQRSPELSGTALARLAEATRGMNRRDVERAVDQHLETGRFPAPPTHPTNTCDPETGSWDEQLMDTGWLREEMTRAGFVSRIIAGPYGKRAKPHASVAARFLDAAIAGLGEHALPLAPYFVAHGTLQQDVGRVASPQRQTDSRASSD